MRARAALLARLLYRGASHICQAQALEAASGEAHGFPNTVDIGQTESKYQSKEKEQLGGARWFEIWTLTEVRKGLWRHSPLPVQRRAEKGTT